MGNELNNADVGQVIQVKYKVIELHKPDSDNPIKAISGETVKVGRESVEADGWRDWIYCYSLNNNSEGWIPVQMIKVENEHGVLLNDYSANELDVSEGDIVNGEIEINGWVWCFREADFEWGWIPKEKITVL